MYNNLALKSAVLITNPIITVVFLLLVTLLLYVEPVGGIKMPGKG